MCHICQCVCDAVNNANAAYIQVKTVYHVHLGTTITIKPSYVLNNAPQPLTIHNLKEHAVHVSIHARLVCLTFHVYLVINQMKSIIIYHCQLYNQYCICIDV